MQSAAIKDYCLLFMDAYDYYLGLAHDTYVNSCIKLFIWHEMGGGGGHF